MSQNSKTAKMVFPCDPTLSHNTSVTYGRTDGHRTTRTVDAYSSA